MRAPSKIETILYEQYEMIKQIKSDTWLIKFGIIATYFGLALLFWMYSGNMR
jgi:hypothetical protein